MERFSVGRCRSGKLVTSHPEFDELETAEELFDALAMLSVITIRELRRHGLSSLVSHLEREIKRLEHHLGAQRSQQMTLVGARTSIDLLYYAHPLLFPEFRE